MPAIKGRRNGQKNNAEDTVELVKENDDVLDDDALATKTKGRAVVKKAKAMDSKKEDGGNEDEDVESVKNGKDEEDATIEKSVAKPRGKAVAKKPAAKDSDDPEEPLTNKKASKRGNSAKDSNNEDDSGDEPVKTKKASKKEEVLPTRRGGDRAAKKVVAYETEERAPAKKSRSAKAKNGAAKVASKDDSKKRGRGGKKGKGDTETDDAMETLEDSEAPTTTVSVEHCKS